VALRYRVLASPAYVSRLGNMSTRYARLTRPLVRDGDELRPASWDEALDRAAAGFRKALDEGTLTGLFSCSKTTNELNFAAQKLSRVALHSNNIDSCNRT
jgi:formate dehydrogenase (hydrogenase)